MRNRNFRLPLYKRVFHINRNHLEENYHGLGSQPLTNCIRLYDLRGHKESRMLWAKRVYFYGKTGACTFIDFIWVKQ
jgi:hypothetical protein